MIGCYIYEILLKKYYSEQQTWLVPYKFTKVSESLLTLGSLKIKVWNKT